MGMAEFSSFVLHHLTLQSFTAILLQASDHRVIHVDSVNFDAALPSYGTQSGMHVAEGGKVTSPVMMWLEALDMLLSRIDRNLLSRVVAISGAAQQVRIIHP